MLIFLFLFLKTLRVLPSTHRLVMLTTFLRIMLWNGQLSSSQVTSTMLITKVVRSECWLQAANDWISKKTPIQETAYKHSLLDPILHGFRFPGEVFEDSGQEWLQGISLGEIFDEEWRVPDSYALIPKNIIYRYDNNILSWTMSFVSEYLTPFFRWYDRKIDG